MIPLDLWTAEGRAELTAHFETMDRIQALDAEMRRLEDTLPDWLRRPAAETLAPLEGPEAERAARAASVAKWTQAAIDEWTDPPAAPEIEPAAEAPAEAPDFADIPIAPALYQPRSTGHVEITRSPLPVDVQIDAVATAAQNVVSTNPAGNHPVTTLSDDPTDPERWIDDAMKAQIWQMDQDGHQPAAIAVEMSLAPKRVQNLLYRIKAGKHPIPGEASTAIATTSTGGALVVPDRGIARDPEMVQQWQDELAEAERRKFVARSEYPEMHP